MWGGKLKIAKLERPVLAAAGRWDIDFHLPPEGIKQFNQDCLVQVDTVADVATEKRDPANAPEAVFQYIDIASVDVAVGAITNAQETLGEEAPSRARKVVSAFDVIVSTCRPTRGAIAVVPESLHDQIASTAFTVLRPRAGVNPYYLHFALRLPSTLEQFRKWSTGSSYPAILDEDVKKTLIPMVEQAEQDAIAIRIMQALTQRSTAIALANEQWQTALGELTHQVAANDVTPVDVPQAEFTLDGINRRRDDLPPLTFEVTARRARAAAAADQPLLLQAAE
jgi:type I restriction enzyme S subunit